MDNCNRLKLINLIITRTLLLVTNNPINLTSQIISHINNKLILIIMQTKTLEKRVVQVREEEGKIERDKINRYII